jgi:hypothetical protein
MGPRKTDPKKTYPRKTYPRKTYPRKTYPRTDISWNGHTLERTYLEQAYP